MNDLTVKLANIIHRTIMIRYNAFDQIMADAAEEEAKKKGIKHVDYAPFHRIQLKDACTQACMEAQEPGLIALVNMMLHYNYDSALTWSKAFVEKKVLTPKEIIDQFPALREGVKALEYDSGSVEGRFDSNILTVQKYMNLQMVDYSAQLAQNATFASMKMTEDPGFGENGEEPDLTIHEYMAGGDYDTIEKLVKRFPQFHLYHQYLELMFGESSPEELGMFPLELVE